MIWHNPDQSFNANGSGVPGPHYVGDAAADPDFVIDLKLLVQPGPIDPLPRSVTDPGYFGWTPGHRLAYLNWLTGGRTKALLPEMLHGFCLNFFRNVDH